jgi:DNA-binding transcriptional LysR family regulator
MELRHLRYFVAVAEAGHFRRAAAALNIAQPALSRQIQALEREMEVTLFERLPRGVRLSDAGRAFLEDARRILDEAEAAAERARRVARGQIGTLRLACSEAASAHSVVTEAIRTFRGAEPAVELSLVHMVSNEQLAALTAGQIDAGFVFRSAASRRDFASLAVDRADVLAALPSGHALAGPRPLRLAELEDQPLICIARRINPHYYDSLMAACARGGLVPRIIQEANTGILMSLVAVGMGVGIVSSAARWHAPNGVVLKKIEDLTIPTHLDLVWRRDDGSGVLRRFCETVRAIARRANAAVA